MRRLWKDVMLAVFMGWVIPGLLINAMTLFLRNRMPQEQSETETVPTEIVEEGLLFRVQDTSGEIMEIEEMHYLTGVVLAEMPAYFEEEALKAQAVVARTYAIKAMVTGGKHGNGSVCMEPGCCQAYRFPEEYMEHIGTEAQIRKVQNAVSATKGLVLTYEGELIEATYFSCSGGTTEAAAAVWGTDFPYLQSVESPGEEEATYYRDTMTMTIPALSQALDLSEDAVMAKGIGQPEYTAGGGIAAIEIGGETFSGTYLREKLGLRSTVFEIRLEGYNAVIDTMGYGHRVGMSQYGADAMAAGGSSFEEILMHYYTGTTIQDYNKILLQNE